MLIELKRKMFAAERTMSEMFVDGAHFGYCLEDTCRYQNGDASKKVQNETCIDAGTYKVMVDYSNHFQKELPHILNVPCFEGVRIHGGNTEADTEGCILVGSQTDWATKIWNCAERVETLTTAIKAAGEATIIITNETAA